MSFFFHSTKKDVPVFFFQKKEKIDKIGGVLKRRGTTYFHLY